VWVISEIFSASDFFITENKNIFLGGNHKGHSTNSANFYPSNGLETEKIHSKSISKFQKPGSPSSISD